MSELVITAANFVLQPLIDARNGPAKIRWAYNRSFLDSNNVQVQWGTQTSGFAVETPCSIADGLIVVDQDTLLWTTDNAQDTNPLSIFLSAWLLTTRDKLIQQLQIAGKAQFVVPSSLAPSTSWAEFSNYNQAVALYYYNPNYYNAPEVDRQIRLYAATNYASETNLGGVFTSVEPAIASQPVAWITDDPLVRDAVKIEGVPVSDTPPLDGQVLTYNQANNEVEWGNQNPGTGNVISNEIASVDGEGAVFSGTGGKTIRRLSGSGLVLATDGVLAAQTATQSTALLNNVVGDSGAGGTKGLAPAPAAGDAAAGKFLKADGTYAVPTGTSSGDIKSDGTVAFTANESMGGFNLTDLATPDDLTDAANKDFVLQSVAAAVQQTPNISALVSGGGVIWESAYIFRVSQATYLIQGDLFSSIEQTITLNAADPSLDRIDVIALNTSGTVVKITGTAAAQPSQPDVDPGTQLQLTFVFVGAATSAPANVVNDDIYIDNAEWAATTSGTGWNPNSTNNPHSGTKDIEGTNVANNAYVQLQAPAPLTLDAYALLSVFIRSKATWPKNRSLLFQWYSAGVAKGAAVTINTGFFGFDSSQVAAYQLLAIPMGQFAVPAGTSINQLRITDKGGAIGMYLDDLVLQAFGGDIGPPATSGLTQEQADARYLQQANNLSDVVSASAARASIGAQAGPLTGDVTTSGAAATLANTAVAPGSYTNTNLTVDAKGRVTAAANGAAGPGSSIPATVQGDTLFASAVNTLAALAKDTNATRYLSNTGSSNNPAWAQVALATGISGFGTSVATALGVNVGSAGALIVNGGVLGTPSSGTLSACAGLPISTGVSGLGTGVATFLGTPSSANLAAALTDETGSGAAVFGTSPVFTADITLPNGTSPTTGSVAKVAFDTNAWGASRGAIQIHDGTANTYVVAALASDTPTNGQVPTWNTGGTITWETPSSGGTPGGSTTQVQYNSSGAFAGSSQFVFTPAASPNIILKTSSNGHDNIRLENLSGSVTMLLTTADIGGIGQGGWLSTNGERFRIRTTNTGGGGAHDYFDFQSNGTSTVTTGLDGNDASQYSLLLNNQQTVGNKFRIFGVQNNGTEVFAVRPNGIIIPGAEKYVSTQFDKTNTTLADVTGLSVGVIDDKIYRFEADLYVNADAAGGAKFAIAINTSGAAQFLIYEIMLLDESLDAYTIVSRQTSSGGSAGQTGTTAGYCRIVGIVKTHASLGSGTITVQFAQNAASGTSSVLVGSTLRVRQLN